MRLTVGLLLCLAAFAQKKPVTLEIAARPASADDTVRNPLWSPDSKSLAWIHGNDVWLYEVSSKARKVLLSLKTLESAAVRNENKGTFDWQNRRVSEQRLQWTPDSRSLVLLAAGDLFLYNIGAAKHQQLTSTPEAERDPKVSPDGKVISFTRSDEIHVLELATSKIRRLTHDATATLWNGRPDWVYPEELDLGTAHWWSPDSKSIAFLQFDVSREWIYPHTSLLDIRAVYEPQRYPKAGTPNPDVRLGVLDVAEGKLKWNDLGDTREALLARIAWLPDSSAVAVQRLNRIQNRLSLLFADIATGSARSVLTETDPYWVNVTGDLHFLRKRREFLWSSESTGYRHLYTYSYDGMRTRQLTAGDWEVKSVAAVDEERELVYFHSRERTPLGWDLAAVPLRGGNRRLLTEQRGQHTTIMSPDARLFVDAFTSRNDPPQKLLRSTSGDLLDTLQGPSPAAAEYEMIAPEILPVKTRDGATLYARLLRPSRFETSRKYPAIVMVYGGPHAQNVCECYSGLSYDQYLAQHGYVVWQLDNRGTYGRGHAFETKLFRRLGQQELADQIEGIQHLLSMGFVDEKRIGMHGWSYGGFMTLYSLLNAPDLFRAGIAGAPVVDWRLYDTIYTERYLGLPQENEEGYRQSSPITYAEKLSTPLLLVHNFDDDNVLFQNSMQMMVALQKAGKQYDTMLYPQRTHGVTGPAKKHMYEAMTLFFDRHLKN